MAKTSNKTILVTGATGHQGGAVLHHLRGKFPLRVLTRKLDRPEALSLAGQGVELAQGDLNDVASVERAMDGLYGAYSVQKSKDNPAEVPQGINVVDAARRQELDHFVYSSVVGADQHTGIPHFETKYKIEQHLNASGIPHTILRPVFFMDNWFNWKDQILNGHLELPLKPDTPFQMIAVDDIGAFAALAFQHPGKWIGRTFEIAGDDIPMSHLCQAFSRVLGREVKYVQISWEEFQKRSDPARYKMFQWFEDVQYRVDLDAVRSEHPQTQTFEHWLQNTWRAQIPADAARR